MKDIYAQCQFEQKALCTVGRKPYKTARNKFTSLVSIDMADFLYEVQGSPDSTVFWRPGNRTIEKTVLFGD